MIGASSLGAGFRRLGAYLVGDEGRVEWAETRNMAHGMDLGDGPGRVDPRAVATEMERRAERGRAARPMYHVAIAFDPDDRPTDAEVRGAVDRTLRDLGLEDHQALVVRHNDTDHAHVHVMVNRVGPGGKAWSTSHERRRLRASMEAQERELGVRWTGRNAQREAGVERAGDQAAAGLPERDRGFAAEVRSRALGDLREATSWDDLRARLGARGYRLERRGQGAVVTDGEREAKLSTVSRTVSRGRLEARLGPLRAADRQRAGGQAVSRGPSGAPAVRGGGPGRPGTGRSPAPPGGLAARLATPRRAALGRVRGLRGAARALGADREQDGGQERAAARAGGRAGRALVRSLAGRRAAAAVPAPRRRTLDGLTRGDGRRLTTGRLAGLRRARSTARVERAVGLIGEVRRRERLDRALHGAAGARGRVGRATQLARAATERTGELDRALGGVYQDPQAARARALRYADAAGPERAARVLAREPGRFGPHGSGQRGAGAPRPRGPGLFSRLARARGGPGTGGGPGARGGRPGAGAGDRRGPRARI